MLAKNRSSTVFVTGSAGRLGRAIVRALVSAGYSVRALAISNSDVMALPAGAVPFVGTLDDEKVLVEACTGADAVIHLAAIVGEANYKINDVIHTNEVGTKNVVEACRKAGCGRIIFASAVDVYGRSRKEVLTEESEPKPSDTYGYSKLLAERSIIESGLKYTILRIATIYGPDFESYFFRMFRVIKRDDIAIIGTGSNHLSLIHVDDVVSAFMLALRKKESVNRTYNVSDGVAYTQRGMLELASSLMGAEKPHRHVSGLVVALLAKQKNLDSDELRFLTSNRVVDITRIRKELGFEPEVSMKAGSAELADIFMGKRLRSARMINA